MKTRQANKSARGTHRGGFTLIEMLVVIIVLLVVMTLTLVLVNQTTKDDKIAAASRQVQSMLEGARDRALHAREPRGVRFLRHPNENDIVTSMVYIGAPGKYSSGRIFIASGGDKRTITLQGSANWNSLVTRGLIDVQDVARIRIDDKAEFYTVRYDGSNWVLTKDFVGTFNTSLTYELDLLPTILPNQEPRELPDGVVIDLDHSQVPGTIGWTGRDRMDVLFSPRGTVIGTPTAEGHIHLVITGIVDVTGTPHKELGDPDKEDAETLVTITLQTGSISTHSVASNDPFNAATNDPFKYAESGVESK